MLEKQTKKCLFCGKEFEVKGSDIMCKKFCCHTCQSKYWYRLKHPEPINKIKCLECGAEFLPRYGSEYKAKYCSKKCKNLASNKRLGVEYMKNVHKLYMEKMQNDPILHAIHLENRRQYSKQPDYRYLAYKKTSYVRGINFNLSFEQFLTFWNKPCNYCGSKIDGVGIDRVDNKIGYELKNCVPCCTRCNTYKMTDYTSDFFSHIKQIYKHSNLNKLA